MSRRRRRRAALRDALALALAQGVQRRLRGEHDVGLAITEIALGGVRVIARVDDTRVQAWIPTTSAPRAVDHVAERLARMIEPA